LTQITQTLPSLSSNFLKEQLTTSM